MKTPDLTLAQIVVLVKNALAVAVAFGAPLTSSERIALLALAGSIGVVLIAADAMIRRSRAQHLAGHATDLAAAKLIADAAATVKANRLANVIESEAAAEKAAADANAPGGVDPALPA